MEGEKGKAYEEIVGFCRILLEVIMRWYIFLPVLLVSLGLWVLLGRFFAGVIVWLVEGGWYLWIDRYEAWWEGVRMPVLLSVGVLILAYLILSGLDWRRRDG